LEGLEKSDEVSRYKIQIQAAKPFEVNCYFTPSQSRSDCTTANSASGI
jgi:hypothetical protein